MNISDGAAASVEGLAEYVYEWHQRPRILVAAVGVGMAALSMVVALAALGLLARGAAPDAATAALACAILAGWAVLALYLAEVRYLGLSGRITFDTSGLRIPGIQMPVLLAVLFVLMAAMPVLPIVYAAVMIVLAVALLVFWERRDVTVSPTGVRRRVRIRRGLRFRWIDTVVAWDDIVAIDADTQVIHGRMTVAHPLIRIRTVSTRPDEQRDALDTADSVVIRAGQLVSEPNTLIALLRHLARHPDRRGAVRQAGARELLRPPPLRERFAAAREARKRDDYV